MQFVNRELSWLSFNDRVLQEAFDSENPIIERIRFLGIYSNNMDEFFRVRVATVKRIIALGGKTVSAYEGTFEDLLEDMMKIVKKQQKKFELAYQKILKELEKENIQHINENDLYDDQIKELNAYFAEKIEDQIVPILLDKKRAVSRLRDSMIYLAVKINADKKTMYALIEVPDTVNRFYVLNDKFGQKVILIDDIIRLNLDRLFHIFTYDSIEAYTFKFTRDAEIDYDDDLSVSIVDKMKKGIKGRKQGDPVRFVYDEQMPDDLFKFLIKKLDVDKNEVITGGKYHNFKDFMKFPSFNKKEYTFKPMPPVFHPDLVNVKSIIKQVFEKDILLHYPYQKFEHVIDLLREAALDPKVESIKINLYRVAKNSQIINALINAIKNDKEVTVIVELQARFDEENNIYWARVLKEYGAKIIFGVSGLKVHSKLILIKRRDKFITHIGTGNFHEKTARIYEDFSLITADPGIASEVNKVFVLFENNLDRSIYKELYVSPFNTRRNFVNLINQEILNVRSGHDSYIILKMNNLIDSTLIKKLYDASNAGVKISLIIRGMCGLVPGIPKQSENIRVISIVGRYLEHSRVMVFSNKGEPKIYISSADWMGRNLDKRIEVTAPIKDPDNKKEILEYLDFQLKDNCKARIIDQMQKNKYYRDDKEKFDSQERTYKYYKQKLKN
ncbi:MAG: polyphosphate kinase 1 [Crocinitomicaceae bacterium]|nr:polyphosphate kinase 1 [Crocinitomicaceae bacterium]